MREVWVHLMVWIPIISFPAAYSISQFGKLEPELLPRILCHCILLYTNYLILVPKFLLRKKTSLYIIISIFLLIAFNYIINNSFVPFPFRKIQDLSESSEQTQYLKILPYAITPFVSLAFFLVGGVLALTKDFYKRDRLNQEIRVQRKETELQFLKAQLNPHFLFNSLNSIYSLVRNGSHEAPEAVITLSELMRYMLYEAQQELVPLTKEIDYIKNYVSFQLFRLSDSENVRLKISGKYGNKKIAPLLLIPFVENAFKYGTDFKGKTYVDIDMQVISDSLFFYVKNRIGIHKRDEMNSGIGLTNIKNRLELLYPENHALNIDKEDGNYQVKLELNLL